MVTCYCWEVLLWFESFPFKWYVAGCDNNVVSDWIGNFREDRHAPPAKKKKADEEEEEEEDLNDANYDEVCV